MNSFTAIITTLGDPSVGMRGEDFELKFNGYSKVEEYGSRESVREQIKELFENLTDFTPRVHFSDECFDCGGRLMLLSGFDTPSCVNRNCPGNNESDS